ncbi:hypothetical protein [Lysobacter sp. Hz 25]|uniref:hypothetical protein n=1 Tax=Lysobacter sp. Hz 25 TaxID=3383698 RepID=UPI0038D3C981
MNEDLKLLTALGCAGAVIGIAKMLSSTEKLKPRQIVGRAILSGALGVAAGAIVLLFPGIGFVPQIAVACILASLGVSALEVLFNRFLNK